MSGLEPAARELIQAAVDGEEVDENALAELRASNPEAIALEDELRRLSAVLAQAEPPALPHDLAATILARAETRRPAPPSTGRSWLAGLFTPPLRLGYSFVAGAAAGIAIFSLASQPVDRDDLIGTMAPRPAEVGTTATARLALPAVVGSLELVQTGDQLRIAFEGTAHEPVQLRIRGASAGRLLAFAQSRPAAAPVALDATGVSLALEGEQSFMVAFEQSGTGREEFTIDVVAGDRLLESIRLGLDR